MRSVTSGTGCPDGLTLGWKSQPVLCVLMAFFFSSVFFSRHLTECTVCPYKVNIHVAISFAYLLGFFFFPSVLIAALFAFVEGKWNLTEKPLPSRKTVQLEPISPLAFQSKWKEGGADNSLECSGFFTGGCV